MPQIVNIAIDRLFPHADNPRKDLGDLSELADSIKVSGVLQNLTVVPRTRNMTDEEYKAACEEYRANPTEESQRVGSKKIVTQNGQVLSCEYTEDPAKATGVGYVPHWATCPYPGQFRRKHHG